MATISPIEAAALEQAADAPMLAAVEGWAAINSGSHNLPGLARMADGKSIRYVTVNDKLTDASGALREGMMVDGLHPSLQGYQLWADALKPILTELLGPPAATDQAPPPTGDPSAKKP